MKVGILDASPTNDIKKQQQTSLTNKRKIELN